MHYPSATAEHNKRIAIPADLAETFAALPTAAMALHGLWQAVTENSVGTIFR